MDSYQTCFVHPNTSTHQGDQRHFYTTSTNAIPANRQYDRISQSNSNQRNQQKRSRPSSVPKLEKPEVIFSNNHLLVVNKTPGWKSQPGEGSGNSNSGFDPKCLLSYLQKQGLGGGSQKDFLNPTHRLDQPCSGVLIFAKNAKAASRVQTAWSKRQIEKCYWVVVEGGRSHNHWKLGGLELLEKRSTPQGDGSFRLSAMVNSKKVGNGGKGSVSVKPVPPAKNAKPEAISKKNSKQMGTDKINNKNKEADGRLCHIEWKHLERLPDTEYSTTRHLLSVKTDTGAKHQVRALLAIAGGAPISGDLRYGDNILSINQDGGRVRHPLRDKSVALHARSVFLPTVSLGGMEFLKEDPFVADIPKCWREIFGVAFDKTPDDT